MEYQKLNPSTLLNPVPVVLVSCAEKDHPEKRNMLTVAWAGTVNSDPPMLSISVRKSRYSHGMILRSGEFAVNLTDEKLCRAADFCGVRSGRDVDKAAETGLKYIPAEGLETAPAVEGAPVCLSCKVREVKELGSHDLFLSEIVGAAVRADLMDEKGSLHLEKAGLIAYNHGLYQKLGDVLGFFGWSVARPETLARRMGKPGPDYALMTEQSKAFAAEEPWFASLLSNVSALIWQQVPDLNWAGFYLSRGKSLVLGPFQGKPACIRIPFGKGVCGTAAAENRTIVVPDVHLFPGHIACDAESRSEMVIPLRQSGRVIGVLDLDSPLPDRFTEEDRAGLEALAKVLEEMLEF